MKNATSLFFSLFIFTLTLAQAPKMRFNHLMVEDGLAGNTVNCILQDSKGFIWFGTNNGLCRYDGYRFVNYQKNPKDTLSLNSNRVTSIIEDSQGKLLVGTWEHGFSIFDPLVETFKHYPFSNSDTTWNPVKTIIEDHRNQVWVGTLKDGLYKLDRQNNVLQYQSQLKYNGQHFDVQSIVEDSTHNLWVTSFLFNLAVLDKDQKNITVVVEASHEPGHGYDEKKLYLDNKNNIWITTFAGFSKYNIATKQNETFANDPANPQSLSSNVVRAVIQDYDDNYYIGTDGKGVDWFEGKTRKFYHNVYESNKPNKLSTNAIYCFYKSNTGIIWIGTFNGGVNIWNPNESKFTTYASDEKDPQSLSYPQVLAICQDNDGDILIGTDGGGLNLFNSDKYGDVFKRYTNDPLNPYSAPRVVKSIFKDSEGNILMGTWGQGMAKFDKANGTFTYTIINGNQPNVWCFAEDKDKNLWISALGFGLAMLDKKTNTYKYYVENKQPNSLRNSNILCMLNDSRNRLWFGTEGGGLHLYNPQVDGFINFRHDDKNFNSISANDIRTIFEDSKGNLWIGTEGGGMSKLNNNAPEGVFVNYTVKDGLPSNVVRSILEDANGNLWIGTTLGLSKFDTTQHVFRNYDKTDGLQSNDFAYSAAIKSADGRMYFGGIGGFSTFYPDQISSNPNKPDVVITDLLLFNKLIKPNDETGVLNKSISYTPEITLKHEQSVFTIKYVGLNFTMPQKNQYAFMMEGFEKNWNYVGDKRDATYTNLDPGVYIFRIKASNNDGLWNEAGTSLKIIILPPWWKTLWFRLLVIVAVLSLVLSFYFYRINTLKRAQRVLEQKVKERTAELQEVNILLEERQEEIMQQNEHIVNANEQLERQNTEIERQNSKLNDAYGQLSMKNQQITGSIRYAQTIQKAILPKQDRLNMWFDSFIFYKPKDIVSGDFYWFASQYNEETKINQLFVAVVDCTGHGVPGAFMSMIGNRLLNEIVNERKIYQPAVVLSNMHMGIVSALQQQESDNNDGMDISLCLFEPTVDNCLKTTFAGAKSSMFYYKNSDNTITTINGNNKSIGGTRSQSNKENFTQQEFLLTPNDCLYIFSDGIIDQNDKNRKRFGSGKLKDILLQNATMPMQAQHDNLHNSLQVHQADEEQRDDITLIGLRLR